MRLNRRPGALVATVATVALLACGSACARPGGGPEGGPPDVEAPILTRVTPDSGRTNVRPPAVVFRFNERVSERPTAAPTLDRMFVVSPRDGNLNVEWHRDAITVRPRRGWRPNTTYTVSMLPGIADLRGNISKTGASLTFSTGATIARTVVTGVAFDWGQGRPLARGYAQAYLPGDTTLVWVAPLDSGGGFTLRSLPPNSYVIRAFADDNGNTALDAREAYDSALVTLADSARLELYAFVHDTVGPRVDAVTVEDSVTLRVKFDRPLLPTVTVSPALFVLSAADSSVVAVASAQPAGLYDSLRTTRSGARSDSLGRVNLDSVRGADPAYAARRDSASAARIDALRRLATGDTTRARRAAAAPTMHRARPVSEVVITVAAPLKVSTLYRLQAHLTGLLGRERTSDRPFRTPAPPKPPAVDSSARTTPRTSPPRPRPATSTPATAVPPSPQAARPDSARVPPVRVP